MKLLVVTVPVLQDDDDYLDQAIDILRMFVDGAGFRDQVLARSDSGERLSLLDVPDGVGRVKLTAVRVD